jgi:hypothetical protein
MNTGITDAHNLGWKLAVEAPAADQQLPYQLCELPLSPAEALDDTA